MALSNYRAFYERTYYKDGVWHTEEEREAAQLYSSQTYPNGYYQAYRESSPLTGGLSGITISSLGDACYANYLPGEMFLPKKYYKITDLFDASDIAALRDFFLDYIEGIFAIDPTYNASQGYYYHSKNMVFWKNSLDQYIVPYFDLSWSYSTTYKRMRAYINLMYYVTTIEPSRLYSKWENSNGHFYYLDDNGAETELSFGSTIVSNGYLLKGDLSDHPANVPAYPTFSEISGFYNRWFEQITNVRFHMLYNTNGEEMASTFYDGVAYFTKKASYGTNKMLFMCDLKAVPYVPRGGFIILGQNGLPNFASRITSKGGPDPNDPYEEDDPYDDDPGDDDDGGDGDHDDSDDDVPLPGPPTLSASGVSLITVYNPNSSQLEAVANKLWSPDFLEVFKQYFTSPMEAILGLAIIPVNPETASSKNVHLGGYDTEVSAPIVTSDYVIVNCGSVPINRYWGSYLDYDPYTKISCYLPYIGEIDINPDQVMQKSLGIYYYVNVVTGDIVAVLTADGSVFSTAAGNCIRQLPIAQQDYSAIINTAVSAVGAVAVGIATAGAGATGVAATASRAGVTSAAVKSATAHAASANVASGASLLGNVTTAKKHYQHAGTIGTGSGQLAPQKPFLTIERPNLDLADAYKSFVGYPCNKTLELGDCHGYTQIEATKLSVPSATDDEVAEIIEILTQGVLL